MKWEREKMPIMMKDGHSSRAKRKRIRVERTQWERTRRDGDGEEEGEMGAEIAFSLLLQSQTHKETKVNWVARGSHVSLSPHPLVPMWFQPKWSVESVAVHEYQGDYCQWEKRKKIICALKVLPETRRERKEQKNTYTTGRSLAVWHGSECFSLFTLSWDTWPTQNLFLPPSLLRAISLAGHWSRQVKGVTIIKCY